MITKSDHHNTFEQIQLVQNESFRKNLYDRHPVRKQKRKYFFWGIIVLVIFILLLFVILCGKKLRFFFINQNEEIYDLVTLNTTTALCLDGSPASYILSRSGDPSKILIFFPPGGWCAESTYQSTLQSFYSRSKTSRGSSTFLPQESSMQFGILSNHPKNYFKDWKKVYFHYCDGSGFQGTRQQPIQYKDRLLYFRGHNITAERFEDLESMFGLFTKVEKVVISGESAGGLSTLMWTNYLAERVQRGKVWSLADASIFYDTQLKDTGVHLLKEQFINMMNITNIQINPPIQECISEYPNARENCMFAQHIIKHIKVPLFLTQSLYDSYTLRYVLGIDCIQKSSMKCGQQDMEIIDQNKLNVIGILQQVAKNNSNGVWGIACVKHQTFSRPDYTDEKFSVPQNSMITASHALHDWMTEQQSSNIHLDQDPWPMNKQCA